MERNKIKNYLTENLRIATKGMDYADIRVGGGYGTSISIRKRMMEEVSKPRSFGGCVRVLYKGGWGYVSFSEVKAVPEAVDRAVAWAKRVGTGRSQLAEVKPVKASFKWSEKEAEIDNLSLSKKVDLIKSYDDLVWSEGKKLANVVSSYSDTFRYTIFVSTEGAEIDQEKGYAYSAISMTAQEAGVIQRYVVKLCDNDLSEIYDRKKDLIAGVKTVEEMVSAPVAKSGKYTIIADPKLAAVFAHEAFGHLSEADTTYENPQLAGVMKLGRKFGSTELTIVDDPTRPGFRGSYIFDDEGVEAKPALLLDKGVLVGRMHSRETAGKLGEKPNGHARAGGLTQVPLVRMGITCIEPGNSNFEKMLENVDDGLYCIDWQAGNTDHERFTFTAGYAREIKKGKLGRVVRDVKLAGNLFETLANVEMVGRKVEYTGGTCGKGGQYIPETSGAPHILVRDLMVMGG